MLVGNPRMSAIRSLLVVFDLNAAGGTFTFTIKVQYPLDATQVVYVNLYVEHNWRCSLISIDVTDSMRIRTRRIWSTFSHIMRYLFQSAQVFRCYTCCCCTHCSQTRLPFADGINYIYTVQLTQSVKSSYASWNDGFYYLVGVLSLV
jgi:hypothetical protein